MEPCRFLSILPFPFPFFRFPPFSFYPHFPPFPPYPLCPLLTSMSRESPPTDPSGYHCEFPAGPGKARLINSRAFWVENDAPRDCSTGSATWRFSEKKCRMVDSQLHDQGSASKVCKGRYCLFR